VSRIVAFKSKTLAGKFGLFQMLFQKKSPQPEVVFRAMLLTLARKITKAFRRKKEKPFQTKSKFRYYFCMAKFFPY